MLVLAVMFGFLLLLTAAVLMLAMAALRRREQALEQMEKTVSCLKEEQKERETAFSELEESWKTTQEQLRCTENDREDLKSQLQRTREELRQTRKESDIRQLEWERKIGDLQGKLSQAEQREHELKDEIEHLEKRLGEHAGEPHKPGESTEAEEEPTKPPIPPDKRGGRSRGPSADNGPGPDREKEPHGPPRQRQQMVCQKEDWRWNLRMENEGGEYQETTELRVEEAPILFKLTGQEMREGYRVKSPSRGMYLAVVPETWRRDQERSGPPPIEPESVSIAGWRAHYFSVEGDEAGSVAFRKGDGAPVEIPRRTSHFRLVGNPLRDATENIGPLFGGEPPEIEGRDERAWQSAATVVVGEEGPGQNRWRMPFELSRIQTRQKLPSEIADRRSGWYFLRFYDQNDELIESMDFRFMKALKNIKHATSICLPPENGYGPARVELIHEAGCDIHARDRNIEGVEIDRQHARTILTIPPNFAADKTGWIIRSEGAPQVEVTVLLERIWWAFGIEAETPTQWVDKPLVLSRDDFRANSEKVLWVRLPKPRWTDNVYVGFDRARARPYRAEVSKNTICVPLRDYADTQERSKPGKFPFRLWLNGREPFCTTASLEVALHCKYCTSRAFSDEDALDHAERHIDNLFLRKTPEELKGEGLRLPPRIQKCPYCPLERPYYFDPRAGEPERDNVPRHIERCHPESREHRDDDTGGIRVLSVTDQDEILNYACKYSPRQYRWCALCNRDKRFGDHNQRGMIDHLKEHKADLYELR